MLENLLDDEISQIKPSSFSGIISYVMFVLTTNCVETSNAC